MKRLAFFLFTLGLAGCEIRRDRPVGEGYHEAGWANTKDGGKHALWLQEKGYPIEDCQVCHGTDISESPVLVRCNSAGCHEQGVAYCGTCHGGAAGPRPSTGAHDKHSLYCAECHTVPKNLRDKPHLSGNVDVFFSGLATHDNALPTWDVENKNCTKAYCHVQKTITWQTPANQTTPCDFCHGNPPESHARYARVAMPASCTTCHPGADTASHVNGSVETNEVSCSTCHGQGSLGAPPVALDGSTDATNRGVGAHARHLDETLSDRIGQVVACTVCHAIPATFDAPGHIDSTTPADVSLTLGQYDAQSGRCTTSCHFDTVPGPLWTDASGAARACDACHGYPPAFTRKNTPHTPSTACSSCHGFSPQTHVDGVVDVTP